MDNQINTPENPPQDHPPIESFPKKNTKHWGVIIGVIVLVILAAGVFAAWKTGLIDKFTKKNNQPAVSGNNPNSGQTNSSPFPSPVSYNPNSANQGQEGYLNDLVPNREKFDCTSTTPSLKKLSGEIVWQERQLVSSSTIFKSGNPFVGQPDYYKIGRFANGKYEGATLYFVDEPCDGMCFNDTYYYLVKKDNNLAILSKHSSLSYVPMSPSVPEIGIDNDYLISDLNYPFELPSPQGPVLEKINFSFHPFCAVGKVKLFTDINLGDVYIDAVTGADNRQARNGFYLKGPDGFEQDYQLKPNFIGTNNVPLITWNDGKKNTQEYNFTDRTGCGSYNYISVVSGKEINITNDLKAAGTTFSGDTVYVFKDSENVFLKTTYESWNTYIPEGQGQTYDQFLSKVPVFFWKDPFGRLIKFLNAKMVPVAECGKPVIYLYPEKTQKISVKLSPIGGFSYTEPDYNNGWNVLADPFSNITNLADGKTYPYLFWEGRGGIYQTPKDGFMVSKTEVHEFLESKLTLAGLNAKETKDFEEFWEPKMQSAPYYFITFMGNSVMDEIAPLNINPKPDTVIRLLMDFTPLNQPISVTGYNIKTPQRKGFTVVEWGGVLRK